MTKFAEDLRRMARLYVDAVAREILLSAAGGKARAEAADRSSHSTEWHRRKRQRLADAGLCVRCGEHQPQAGRRRCRECLDYISEKQRAYFARKMGKVQP